MNTLVLQFDFSKDPLPDDRDMSTFRYSLSRRLDTALRASGSGRWRGSRYARGIVTFFLDAPDRQAAMINVRSVLSGRGLVEKMTVYQGR